MGDDSLRSFNIKARQNARLQKQIRRQGGGTNGANKILNGTLARSLGREDLIELNGMNGILIINQADEATWRVFVYYSAHTH